MAGNFEYTLKALTDCANELRKKVPELRGTAAISERTVRYYIKKGLLPKTGTRGPSRSYSEAVLYRLLFIRRVQKEEALTLEDIKQTLQKLADSTIKRVALGQERLKVDIGPETDGQRLPGEQVFALERPRPVESLPSARLMEEAEIEHGPRDYIRSVRSEFEDNAVRRQRRGPRGNTYHIGKKAELRVDVQVTKSQDRQLRIIAQLIKGLLEGSGK